MESIRKFFLLIVRLLYWDYSDSCNETNSYRKIDLEHKASVDEMFSKIVREGYQEIIKDKPHSIDKKSRLFSELN